MVGDICLWPRFPTGDFLGIANWKITQPDIPSGSFNLATENGPFIVGLRFTY